MFIIFFRCTAITTLTCMLSTVMPVSAYMALAFVFGFIQINWWWWWWWSGGSIVFSIDCIVAMIAQEPLHIDRWNFARTWCTLTFENLSKPIGYQGHIKVTWASCAFLSVWYPREVLSLERRLYLFLFVVVLEMGCFSFGCVLVFFIFFVSVFVFSQFLDLLWFWLKCALTLVNVTFHHKQTAYAYHWFLTILAILQRRSVFVVSFFFVSINRNHTGWQRERTDRTATLVLSAPAGGLPHSHSAGGATGRRVPVPGLPPDVVGDPQWRGLKGWEQGLGSERGSELPPHQIGCL